MRRTGREWFVHGLLTLVGCTGALSCAQTAAVEGVDAAAKTAKAAVDTAGSLAEAIPDAVRKAVDAFVAQNRPNWGKPSHVFVSEDQYVLYYPTPESERRQGRVRAIIVNRTDGVARLLRMQNGG